MVDPGSGAVDQGRSAPCRRAYHVEFTSLDIVRNLLFATLDGGLVLAPLLAAQLSVSSSYPRISKA